MLFRVALAVAVLAIFVYGLVDVIRTDGRLTRGISKPAWIVVMIVLPVIGAILWLLIGRPRGTPPVRQNYGHPTAPDDDPAFLRNLEVQRRNQAEAARLKKLKDDLEAKAAKPEGNGPTGSGPAGSGSNRSDSTRTGSPSTGSPSTGEGAGTGGPGSRGAAGKGTGPLEGEAAGDAGSGDADTHDTDELK